MKQLVVIFSGRVQGVGFRYSVEHFAKDFLITGYVKNLMSSQVELIAEGEDAELTAFLNKILNSPLKRYITNYQSNFREPLRTFKRFTIAY